VVVDSGSAPEPVLDVFLTEGEVKKLILLSVVVLFLATEPVSAQQFIGGSGDYGRRHSYRGSSIVLTPRDLACLRANYATMRRSNKFAGCCTS
jgi:hypothetical protein